MWGDKQWLNKWYSEATANILSKEMGYDEDDDGIIAKLQQSFFQRENFLRSDCVNVWLWYKGYIKDAVFHPELDQYCQQ